MRPELSSFLDAVRRGATSLSWLDHGNNAASDKVRQRLGETAGCSRPGLARKNLAGNANWARLPRSTSGRTKNSEGQKDPKLSAGE
jgi:hypothetical protein